MTESLPVLALDTATPYLTLALRWSGGELESATRIERAHAERLADGVAELFAAAGLPLRAGCIVLGTGPGSYTGVRIGASYALGLARVWGVPLLGVPTLEALAGTRTGRVAAASDARKGNVYGAVYEVTEGRVSAVLKPTAKYALTDFEALAQADGAELRLDPTPSGLGLLHSGLAHGQTDWSLAYL